MIGERFRVRELGLRAQVSAIVLLGLILSQLLALSLYTLLLPRWQHQLRPEAAVAQIALEARLLELSQPLERERFGASLGTEPLSVRWRPATAGSLRGGENDEDESLRSQIAAALGKAPAAVRVRRAAHGLGRTDVVVSLSDGSTLEFRVPIGGRFRLGAVEQVGICAFFAVVFGGLWLWMSSMLAAPLARFAQAAERIGRNIRSPSLALEGPAELRRAMLAFNDMHHRLQTMIEDRLRMLGAISHDLRTPLTRLRLRVENEGAMPGSSTLLKDIGGMEAMLVSVFAFIRGVDDGEPTDVVDLTALVQTVCDSVVDTGGRVTFTAAGTAHYACRPNALERALSNVIGNAVRYADAAEVHLGVTEGEVRIAVEDAGPGIPDADKARVFEPFYRREATRALDPGGLGLGLSITRAIVLAHGGTIELEDATPCGLRVLIRLPLDDAAPRATGREARSDACVHEDS